ncbi:hypothetical protein BX600DRAFT_430897 [Xylariales sp. PMI_506]|nr:hypothetical protein BX600DRAFT_430897 [Xylariales sp. PMI_506]
MPLLGDHPMKTGPNETEEDYVLDEVSLLSNTGQKLDKAGLLLQSRLDPSTLRQLSISPFSQDGGLTSAHSFRGLSPGPSVPPLTPQRSAFHRYMESIWQRNAGPMLIVLSQLFGSLMNLSARLLELDSDMHPLQILAVRMTATIICTYTYMWWKQIPNGPWGPSGLRWLLCLRALSGFAGLYGMWYSIMYLPLAEATVISFLAPNVACYLCRIFLNEPFTKRQQIGSYLAFAGIILITRPFSLFFGGSRSASAAALEEAADDVMGAANATAEAVSAVVEIYVPTTIQRLKGIGMGLVGVIGGGVTFTILRYIGPRAHPLISVTYFGTFGSIISVTTLIVAPLTNYRQPELRLPVPTSFFQIVLLLAVSTCGFMVQFLLTAGLAREKSNRGTVMVYTQILFAAAFDRLIWGVQMGWFSIIGCALVVGSAIWVASSKVVEPQKTHPDGDVEARATHTQGITPEVAAVAAENVPMLANMEGTEDEGETTE